MSEDWYLAVPISTILPNFYGQHLFLINFWLSIFKYQFSAKYCPFLKKSGSSNIILLRTPIFWYWYLYRNWPSLSHSMKDLLLRRVITVGLNKYSYSHIKNCSFLPFSRGNISLLIGSFEASLKIIVHICIDNILYVPFGLFQANLPWRLLLKSLNWEAQTKWGEFNAL